MGEMTQRFQSETIKDLRDRLIFKEKRKTENGRKEKGKRKKEKETSTNFCGPAIRCNKFAAWD